MATAWLEVLGTGTLTSAPSLVVCTETERLLFNCGEGTQRLCTEHGVRVSKLSRIFLTSLSPPCTGGLGGMLLTRADVAGGEATDILGPPGTCDMLRSFRFFYNRPDAQVRAFEAGSAQLPCVPGPDSVTVEPILMGRRSNGALGESNKRPKLSTDKRGLHVGAESLLTPTMCSFLIRLPHRRGRFLPAQAKALGVTQGPDFGRLSRGEAVTVAGGRTVHPSECMEPPEPSAVVLVLACAKPDDLDGLTCKMDEVTAVAHISPPRVLCDPAYASHLPRLFGPSTHHIALGFAPHSALVKSAALQLRLHAVGPAFFPLRQAPPPAQTPPAWANSLPHVRWRFGLCPWRAVGVDASRVPTLPPSPAATTAAAPRPRLVFLGTGSAVPSKYRNVSAFMLALEAGSILLDCGEGSLAQLARVSDPGELAHIDVAWISHMHADHHLGLLALIHHRAAEARGRPLLVVGPAPLGLFLAEFGEALRDGGVFSSGFVFRDCLAPPDPALLAKLGLTAFESVPVQHCHLAFGLVLQTPQWKLVYSGDTVPCDALVRAGLDATVLVHEATFEDGMELEARDKMHSTVSQAVDVARRMRAQHVVLTHFSQRYPKLPPIIVQEHKVCVAFDLMQVGFDSLHELAAMVQQLDQVLDDMDKDEVAEQ